MGAKTKSDSVAKEQLVSPLQHLATTYAGSHAAGTPAPVPAWIHRGMDSDVVVTEVRDTSWKPDEVYSIIERLCPLGRKVELFGRQHNTRPGWTTIGDQLKGDVIHDAELQRKLDRWRRAS